MNSFEMGGMPMPKQPENMAFSPEMVSAGSLEAAMSTLREEQMEYSFAVSKSANLKGLKYQKGIEKITKTGLTWALQEFGKLQPDLASGVAEDLYNRVSLSIRNFRSNSKIFSHSENATA